MTILADPDSMCQEIRRCHLQSFVWLNCIHGENYGWCVRGGDEQLQPVWFTGYQLPQSLRKVNRSKMRTGILFRSVNNTNEPSDGVNESDAESFHRPQRKGRRKSNPSHNDIAVVEAAVECCDVDEGATGEENLVNSIDDESWESDFSTSDSNNSSGDDYWP